MYPWMRWDIRNPEKPFGDRFILVAGHTCPLIYATLAVLNHALRLKYEKTGDPKYAVPDAEHKMLLWEDLMTLRRNGGLPGHAEMEGKTLFFKFNTGPSGHGSPSAAGEAMALLRAGASDTRVFAFEGEGGLTAGAIAEKLDARQNTMSSHLAKLHRAGIVSSERDGRHIIYRADFDAVSNLIVYLMEDCCGGNAQVCEPVAASIQC